MDLIEDTDSLIETIEIAPAGDVILIIGQEETRLRVTSWVLNAASEAFEAPDYRHSPYYYNNTPTEIALPEDEAEAMTIIRNVLHHCNESVPNALSPEEIVKLAIAAEKYACKVALKYAMSQWLEVGDIKPVVELMYLLIAAFMFNNTKAFEKIARALVFNHHDSYITLADNKYGNLLPWRTCCELVTSSKHCSSTLTQIPALLEAQRNQKRAELQQILLDGTQYEDYGCGCSLGGRYAQAHINSLQGLSLWGQPLFSLSVADGLEKAAELQDQSLHSPNEKCTCGFFHAKYQTKKSGEEKLKRVKEYTGWCLVCLEAAKACVSLPCGIEH